MIRVQIVALELHMQNGSPWPHLNIKIVFPGMGFPIIKIRQSHDLLIFIMKIPILLRQHLYIHSSEAQGWIQNLCGFYTQPSFSYNAKIFREWISQQFKVICCILKKKVFVLVSKSSEGMVYTQYKIQGYSVGPIIKQLSTNANNKHSIAPLRYSLHFVWSSRCHTITIGK